jgi:hypothetical protein
MKRRKRRNVHLAPEVVSQHVLGSSIIDGTADVGCDRKSVALLQAALCNLNIEVRSWRSVNEVELYGDIMLESRYT